jgi:hypothetical protein
MRGSGLAAEGVGFQPVKSRPAGTYIGRRSARTGHLKSFYGPGHEYGL